MYPMFEKNGCKLYGSGSYQHGYFDTCQGEFKIVEVLHYYDLPLLMFIQGPAEEYYLAAVCGEIFDRDNKDREWAYILTPISNEEKTEIENNELAIDLPFKTQTNGFKITVSETEELQDAILPCDPSDDEKYEHIPNNVYLN